MNHHCIDWFGKPVVLASQSPRRRQILSLLIPELIVHPSIYSENNNQADQPREVVQTHAYHKAISVACHYPDAWIIGADTIVVLGDRILGKPAGATDAIRMLKMLSDRTHVVYTGYCLLNSANGKHLSRVETTAVTFRKLTEQMILYYVDIHKPWDKAGAYAIQDFSAVFVKKIDGCFYNVVGFPLSAFFDLAVQQLSDCL